MLHPDVPLYNIGAYVEINIAVDYELFALAVQFMAAGHDALRTILKAGPSPSELPLQTFADNMTVPVPLLDFSAQDDAEQAALAWMQTQFTQPFPLYEQPLCRFALLKVHEEHYKFFSVYHHLISDGWGIALFNRPLA
jgi:hypothetical protein